MIVYVCLELNVYYQKSVHFVLPQSHGAVCTVNLRYKSKGHTLYSPLDLYLIFDIADCTLHVKRG